MCYSKWSIPVSSLIRGQFVLANGTFNKLQLTVFFLDGCVRIETFYESGELLNVRGFFPLYNLWFYQNGGLSF